MSALFSLFVPHQPHSRAARGIKSKTAVRKSSPRGRVGSNIFGAAPPYVQPKAQQATSGCRDTFGEEKLPSKHGKLSRIRVVLPENDRTAPRDPFAINTRKIATGLNFTTKQEVDKYASGVTPATETSRYEEARTEMQSIYGQPMARIAMLGTGPSPPRIDSSSGCHFITSYNIDAARNIYIPGRPARLSPLPTSPVTLSERSQLFDQLFSTSSPPRDTATIALFTSVRHLNPSFRFGTLDVFSSPERFIQIIRRNRAFTATMFPGGPLWLNTIRPHDIVNSTKVVGGDSVDHRISRLRGRDFEAAITQVQTMGLPSRHFRAVRYKFGSLSLGFINEVDAWDPVTGHDSSHPLDASLNSKEDYEETEDRLLFTGRVSNNSELVEIKIARRESLNLRRAEFNTRAWFARQERLCLGIIAPKDNSIRIENSTVDFSKWEKTNQQSLQRVHEFLCKLRAQISKTTSGIILGIPWERDQKDKSKRWELYEVKADRPAFVRELEMARKMIEYDAGMPKLL